MRLNLLCGSECESSQRPAQGQTYRRHLSVREDLGLVGTHARFLLSCSWGCRTPGRSEGEGIYLGLMGRRPVSFCRPVMAGTPASYNMNLTPPNSLRNSDCWSSAVPGIAIAFVSFWNISSVSQSISCL